VKDPVGWNRSALDFTTHKVEESERSSVVKSFAEGREETHDDFVRRLSPLPAAKGGTTAVERHLRRLRVHFKASFWRVHAHPSIPCFRKKKAAIIKGGRR
jgi:hypothetical protein